METSPTHFTVHSPASDRGQQLQTATKAGPGKKGTAPSTAPGMEAAADALAQADKPLGATATPTPIVLKGITWGHSRGITPLLAFSQRYAELNPGIEIQWSKRTLQEFADFPIEKLTEQYDLLIIDHPWVGCAAATGCVLPLDEYLPKKYLDDQLKNTVGYSHLSYQYNLHQWALAIDAAAPAASYRADLLLKNKQPLPATWNDVIHLAARGKVAVPGIPVDLLMNFYMFCIAHGSEPFSNQKEVIDRRTGLQALQMMQELYQLVDKKMFTLNPIGVAELMTTTDDYWYCPFAYCYSNYAREGYARQVLHYTAPVEYDGKKLVTTIGGTGLAVSAFSRHKEEAVRFAAAIVSGKCQGSFYVEHGGQPGHRAGWTSKNANRISNQFFEKLLPVLENGYVRPRYNGYLYLQDQAGEVLHRFLSGGGKPQLVLTAINQLYKQSLANSK